jgi:hypothetical protein
MLSAVARNVVARSVVARRGIADFLNSTKSLPSGSETVRDGSETAHKKCRFGDPSQCPFRHSPMVELKGDLLRAHQDMMRLRQKTYTRFSPTTASK